MCDYSNMAICVVHTLEVTPFTREVDCFSYVVIFYYNSLKEILETEHSIDIFCMFTIKWSVAHTFIIVVL